MTKIDIFSGFLGAGKTTLIKKLIKEAYAGEKLVLIENEFGEIGIDGGFLKDAGIEITEMNSGCICCSLVGDFATALKKVLDELKPDRIVIEPSGVGKLSDVIRAVKSIERDDAELVSYCAVVDVNKCKMYMKNFGEFYNDQIKHASAIVLSHTGRTSEKKLAECISLVREHNPDCNLITTPWEELDGAAILAAIASEHTAIHSLIDEAEKDAHHHHHHHDHDHHDHEHHEHGEGCKCGCCGHGHDHGHHHADDVFSTFGVETARKFTAEEITAVLEKFADGDDFGMILRAKGIVASTDGRWIHFDYVPGEPDVRYGTPAVIGALCVIGVGIENEKIKELFGV